MPTKFGSQPFMKMLQEQKISQKKAATTAGVPYLHLRHAGYGYVAAKYELRDALSSLLGVSADRLFTPEALEAKPHYGPRARKLMVEARVPGPFTLVPVGGSGRPATAETMDAALAYSKANPRETFDVLSGNRSVATVRTGVIKDISLAA